ncbi:hypothetical protein [Clostridium sp. C105KSO13]|uniref:hypothetical protein n=1 Tax=Clostridium sp. C105KSO13 TaxID=1776045 RepID=UPI000B7D084D|nr:hypothetical protein [Clostridium sp. C105KSO13]
MLDKNRIRLMAKTAKYEKSQAAEDLKISRYYKKDYTSLNTLITAIWVTVGYVLLAGLIALAKVDALMKNLTIAKFIIIVAIAVGIYIVLLVVYCVYAGSFYNSKHSRAKQRVKRYYRNLSRLRKMYVKEKK